MVEELGQYIGDAEASKQPGRLSSALGQAPAGAQGSWSGRRLKTLALSAGPGLPLMADPLISLDSWLADGLPLMGLLLAPGQ